MSEELPVEETEELNNLAMRTVNIISRVIFDESRFLGMDSVAKEYFYSKILAGLSGMLERDLKDQ